MPHKPDNLDRVYHLLDAVRKIRRYATGKSLNDLREDEMLQYSVVHLLEIAGEAASGITLEFRTQYPGIPWRELIDMRNRLIHAYFNISLAIVWETVTNDLPKIEETLTTLFPDLSEE